MKGIFKFLFTNAAAAFFVICFVQAGVTQEGDGSLHSDEPPGVSVLDSMVNLYEAVTFNHEMHMDLTECATCHHHMIDAESAPNCGKCHKEWYPGSEDKRKCQDCHVAERYTAEYLDTIEHGQINHHDHRGLMGAFHNQCLGCHRDNDNAGCQDCHVRREAGDIRFSADAGKNPESGKSKTGH